MRYLICLILLVLVAGCSSGEPPTPATGFEDEFAKEVGLSKVPVMPGSKMLEEETEHETAGDPSTGTYDVTIKNWVYDVDASLAEIQAFYVEKYPNAKVDEYAADSGDPDDESDTMLVIPPEADGVEHLVVLIYNKRFRIGETTRD